MRTKLLVAALVTMALLAGCMGGGSQSATEQNPANATASGEAPQDIETFYVQTEEGEFFCIHSEKEDGYQGYSGLSCTPVESLTDGV